MPMLDYIVKNKAHFVSRSPEGVADSLAASEASLMPSSTPEARLS